MLLFPNNRLLCRLYSQQAKWKRKFKIPIQIMVVKQLKEKEKPVTYNIIKLNSKPKTQLFKLFLRYEMKMKQIINKIGRT